MPVARVPFPRTSVSPTAAAKGRRPVFVTRERVRNFYNFTIVLFGPEGRRKESTAPERDAAAVVLRL